VWGFVVVSVLVVLTVSSPDQQEWWNRTVFQRSLMLFLLVQTGLCLYLVLSDHARWLHHHPSQFNLEVGVSMLVAADECVASAPEATAWTLWMVKWVKQRFLFGLIFIWPWKIRTIIHLFCLLLKLMDTAQHWTTSVISKMSAESSRLVGITLCTDDIFYCMWYVTVGVWFLWL
jgi:hypothetical protein